jgi:hypothetical protein
MYVLRSFSSISLVATLESSFDNSRKLPGRIIDVNIGLLKFTDPLGVNHRMNSLSIHCPFLSFIVSQFSRP